MPVFVYLPTQALEKEFRLIYCAEVHSVHLNKGARLLLEWAGPLENDTKPAFCDGNPIPIFYKKKRTNLLFLSRSIFGAHWDQGVHIALVVVVVGNE